jgi:hypothetical protein
MRDLMWFWISTGYATFGVGVGRDGYVREAAPIAHWTVGRWWTDVSTYYREKKGATVVAL